MDESKVEPPSATNSFTLEVQDPLDLNDSDEDNTNFLESQEQFLQSPRNQEMASAMKSLQDAVAPRTLEVSAGNMMTSLLQDIEEPEKSEAIQFVLRHLFEVRSQQKSKKE